MTHLTDSIAAVEAVEIKGGYRIEAVLADGSREVLKKKSTRKPTVVQAYAFRVNGNFRGEGLGAHIAFTKTVDSHPLYRENHIRTIKVS